MAPTTDRCADCSQNPEDAPQSCYGAAVLESGAPDDLPPSGRLPPDLDQLDEDDEIAAELCAMIREDGQVDMDELQIHARQGLIYLEGAVPSEPEHEILRAILTDVAGVQEIVDNLEVQRLAGSAMTARRTKRSKNGTPGTIPNEDLTAALTKSF
jgi:hypothetical protein